MGQCSVRFDGEKLSWIRTDIAKLSEDNIFVRGRNKTWQTWMVIFTCGTRSNLKTRNLDIYYMLVVMVHKEEDQSTWAREKGVSKNRGHALMGGLFDAVLQWRSPS